MPVDVCIPLGTGSKWKNNELRYTLRALEKNFLDLGRVFVCGRSLPDWLQNVERIDIEDAKRNKDANLIDKVLAALDAGMSDPFVRCSDDETILLPTRIADMHKFHLGDLKGRPDSFWHNNWKHRLRHTRDALAAKGLPTLHYDSHVPTLCNAALFRKVASAFDYRTNPGYTINTLYCNHEGLIDPPKLSGNKLTVEGENKHSLATLTKKFTEYRYLGYNDGGLDKLLKKALQEAFPIASRFEKATAPLPMVVAVVGAPRSGTSCTAGVVHHLGVSMGNKLRPAAKQNPRGFFEALPLREICAADIDSHERVQKFQGWAKRRATAQSTDIIGAKEGKFCNQVAEMVGAWPRLKIIAVERPIEDIAASMQKSGTFKRLNLDESRKFAARWIANRDGAIERMRPDVLRVQFSELVSDPKATIERIINFIEIKPTQEQVSAALAFVDPSLHHNRAQLEWNYCI